MTTKAILTINPNGYESGYIESVTEAIDRLEETRYSPAYVRMFDLASRATRAAWVLVEGDFDRGKQDGAFAVLKCVRTEYHEGVGAGQPPLLGAGLYLGDLASELENVREAMIHEAFGAGR